MEGWSCALVREVSGLGGGQGVAERPGRGPGGVGKDREAPGHLSGGRRAHPGHGGLRWPALCRAGGDGGVALGDAGPAVAVDRVAGVRSRAPCRKGLWPPSGRRGGCAGCGLSCPEPGCTLPCRRAGRAEGSGCSWRCGCGVGVGWGPRDLGDGLPGCRGQERGARCRQRCGCPGARSHRGGAWPGAHVWFEISATSPGLPRDLAARSRHKHWKVGRAS